MSTCNVCLPNIATGDRQGKSQEEAGLKLAALVENSLTIQAGLNSNSVRQWRELLLLPSGSPLRSSRALIPLNSLASSDFTFFTKLAPLLLATLSESKDEASSRLASASQL